MAGLHSFWLIANKNSQHKTVQINCLEGRFSVKKYKRVAESINAWFFYRSLAKMPANQISKITNLIQAFVTGYRFPYFLHVQFPMIDKARVMVHGDWHGNQYSGATLAIQDRY